MYKVLIVEDDPMVAMINEQYTNRNKQFTIVGVCQNGNGALEFLKENEVDLVLLDVRMPDLDGFEVLHQIRNSNMTVDVIMITAANDRASIEEALRLGVVDYLVKPFDFERFSKALDKYVAYVTALNSSDVFNQKNIDFILEYTRKQAEEIHPKGIQEKTLYLIQEYMQQHEGIWMTSNTIATEVGLTDVTVRRYMSYLVKTGKVDSEVNYETGGRPCMLYKAAKV